MSTSPAAGVSWLRVEGGDPAAQAVPQAPHLGQPGRGRPSHREAAARQSQLGTLPSSAQLTELLTQAETVLAERPSARGIAQARKAAYRAGASRRPAALPPWRKGPCPSSGLHRREDTEKGVL